MENSSFSCRSLKIVFCQKLHQTLETVFHHGHLNVVREAGFVLCRVALWDYFGNFYQGSLAQTTETATITSHNGDFKLRSHSISFNLTNVGEFSGIKFQRTVSKIGKEKSVKIRLPSQCYSSIQHNRDSIFRLTCNWLISSTKKFCYALYFLLSPLCLICDEALRLVFAIKCSEY